MGAADEFERGNAIVGGCDDALEQLVEVHTHAHTTQSRRGVK